MFRFHLIRYGIFAGLAILALGLFKTQVIEGSYYRHLGEQNRIRLIPLEAPRGRVLDRNGQLLAANRPAYDIVATPEDISPEVFPRLAKLLNLSVQEIRTRMSEQREYPFAPALMMSDVPWELAFKIEQLKPELPGVAIQVTGLRYYPYKETASHLIGYIGKINPDEYAVKDRQKYGLTSLVGRSGMEAIFDEALRGWRGGRQIEVDARGQLARVLSEKMPEPGKDLVVTLDLEFQKRIMELIKDKHASVAVLDLKTEGLLALASTPAYDPNIFVSPGFSQERLSVLKNSENPLLDRGVSSAYPPGSVFKLITALTALSTGKITPNTRFYCSGQFRLKPGSRPYHCWFKEGHGSLNLYQAIERSCNVYFYELGKRLAPDQIAHYARLLGLGERMKMELMHIAPGLVPDSEWKKKKYKEKWYQGDTISYAIGQSYLLVTPLQILKVVATIAKDGKVVTPHLIEQPELPAEKQTVAIKQEHLEVIRKAMLQVVESKYGTGQLARVDFNKIAAKTGTAQVPPHDPHGWITGFFPYQNPEIAFVVFVEHGGSGGITGAKILKDVIQIWRELYVRPVV